MKILFIAAIGLLFSCNQQSVPKTQSEQVSPEIERTNSEEHKDDSFVEIESKVDIEEKIPQEQSNKPNASMLDKINSTDLTKTKTNDMNLSKGKSKQL